MSKQLPQAKSTIKRFRLDSFWETIIQELQHWVEENPHRIMHKRSMARTLVKWRTGLKGTTRRKAITIYMTSFEKIKQKSNANKREKGNEQAGWQPRL